MESNSLMQPIRRALSVLNEIAAYGGGLTLQELAVRLDLPTSTVHRLTSVLEQADYLVRTPADKRFMLGRAVRALVSSTSSEFLQQAVRPELIRLNNRTQDAVFVAEFVGTDVVCVAFRPGMRPLRLFVSLGAALPPHAASSARVLYASLPTETARTLLKGHQYTSWTPRTITREDQLLRHFELIRNRGYDIDDDEMNDSAWATAAAIRDTNGHVRAAVTVVAPVSQVGDPARRQALVEEVRHSAYVISLALGYPDGTAGGATRVDRASGPPSVTPRPGGYNVPLPGR
jgi:DNA-binding IclR family transcriptional regulator